MVLAMMRKLGLVRSKRRLAVLVGIALLLVAALLAMRVPGGPVAIRTGPVGCYASSIEGELVTDPVDGVALIEPGGHRRSVIWSSSWTGRQSGAEVEILNSRGKVEFRTGSYVHIAGARDPDSDGWMACALEAV
jgi:hypothetical protein